MRNKPRSAANAPPMDRCCGGQTACDQCVNGDRLALLDQALSLALDPVLDGSEGWLKPDDTKNVA